jgi:anti-sigma factor RsiW
MNRSNLRSLPTPAPSPADVASAEAELTALFGGLLARGARDEESPAYELLEAAVDGTLDPVEAERFHSRLAGDPELQRDFDELVALRDRVQGAPAAVRFAPPSRSASHRLAGKGSPSRWLGFAAAAVLLAALGLEYRQGFQHPDAGTAGRVSPASSLEAARPQAEPVFVDSFEGGTTASWSN